MTVHFPVSIQKNKFSLYLLMDVYLKAMFKAQVNNIQ